MLPRTEWVLWKGKVSSPVPYVPFCYGHLLDTTDVWVRTKISEWRMETWRACALNFLVGLSLIPWFYLMISTIMTDSITSLLTPSDNSGINQQLAFASDNIKYSWMFSIIKPLKLMDNRQYGLMRKLLFFGVFFFQAKNRRLLERRKEKVCVFGLFASGSFTSLFLFWNISPHHLHDSIHILLSKCWAVLVIISLVDRKTRYSVEEFFRQHKETVNGMCI
jgi:hypothetical protein